MKQAETQTVKQQRQSDYIYWRQMSEQATGVWQSKQAGNW